jgi:dTDP-4-amino-4,6-dideoxygalactose transaminase
VAGRYTQALDGSALRPVRPTGGTSANHLFAVEVMDGDPAALAERIGSAGVAVGRHYPVLCPDQPACGSVGVALGDLPTARRLAAQELSLPLHPYLTDSEVDHVISTCTALGRHAG